MENNIIYHDNENPCQYDDHGHWADNWNPDAAFPENEYIRVYFRIKTPSYLHYDHYSGAFGFDTEEEHAAFYAEAAQIFSRLGWKSEKEKIHIAHNYICGKAHLFVHPQSVSGDILKNDVKRVAEALNAASGFSVYCVDVYETRYDMPDEAYMDYLRGKSDEIKTAVLAASKTKRRTLFYQVDDVARTIAHNVKLPRIGRNDGDHSMGYGFTSDFVEGIIRDLISAGYLVESERVPGMIRTINKTEQRQRKLSVPA